MRHAILVVAALLTPVAGECADAVLRNGEQIVLKLPSKYIDVTRSKWTGKSTFVVDVAPGGPTGVIVSGDPDWQVGGFPSLTQFTVSKVKKDEVELQTLSGLKIRLNFLGGSPESMFGKVAAPLAGRDAYRREAYAALSTKFFTGPLAALSDAKKDLLLAFAHTTARGTTVGSETFKEKLYLVVNLGGTDVVYNELKLNQAARVAKVMNERLLTVLKAFAAPVADVTDIHGLKLEYSIAHRNFLSASSVSDYDKLEIYAPSDAIHKFSGADITSQQLVDGAVVIVNDNRVQVALAEQ